MVAQQSNVPTSIPLRATSAPCPRRKPTTLPPRAPASKRKKTQSNRRGNGFSLGETENLLELLQENLPLKKDEWEKVTRLHATRYTAQKRNADSLRRKFSALCRTTVPTGDPSIPPDVLKAKAIREEMTERADIGDAAESDEEYTEEINDVTAALQPSSLDETRSEGAVVMQETQTGSTEAAPSNNPSITPSPRPLVRKRGFYNPKQSNEEEIIAETLKVSMLREQMRRDDEHRQRMMDREDERQRREEDRKLREEERAEERERREDDRRRSDRMMQLMMISLLGKRGSDSAKDLLDAEK